MQQVEIVYGVEKLEIALLNADGTVNETSWTTVENIEEGSVTFATTADTRTPITPEDKDTPILVIYVPGDADVWSFALLEFSEENMRRFFNILYDPTTSTITVLSKKKHAKLALRITSRPQEGIKKIFTFKNTTSEASYKNAITKTGLFALSISSSILSWKTEDGQDASYTLQTVGENGEIINSAPTFDTTQTFASSVNATSQGVATTVTETDADTKLEFNKVTDPEGTPVTMTLKREGVTVASVTFPSDYQGHLFKFTASDNTPYFANFTSGTVNLGA